MGIKRSAVGLTSVPRGRAPTCLGECVAKLVSRLFDEMNDAVCLRQWLCGQRRVGAPNYSVIATSRPLASAHASPRDSNTHDPSPVPRARVQSCKQSARPTTALPSIVRNECVWDACHAAAAGNHLETQRVVGVDGSFERARRRRPRRSSLLCVCKRMWHILLNVGVKGLKWGNYSRGDRRLGSAEL